MIWRNSRNSLTAVVEVVDPVHGKLIKPAFVDLRQRVTKKFPEDRFITSDSAHGWAHYADSRLGDARHWWVIADMTGVVDPFEELVPGKQLRVPSVERFLFDIMAPYNQRSGS